MCVVCKNPSCVSLKGGKCPQQALKADGISSQLDIDQKLGKKNKRRKKKVEKDKPMKKKKNAVEESPSLKMFGEEDVEDKSEDKPVIAADNTVLISEEVKQVVVEEDEKQLVDQNCDQPLDKNSNVEASEHKDADPNNADSQAQPESLELVDSKDNKNVVEAAIVASDSPISQPVGQSQNNVVIEEAKELEIAPHQDPSSEPKAEPERPLLKIAKYIIEDDGVPKQAEVTEPSQEPKPEEVKSDSLQESDSKASEDVKPEQIQEAVQEPIQQVIEEAKVEAKEESKEQLKEEPAALEHMHEQVQEQKLDMVQEMRQEAVLEPVVDSVAEPAVEQIQHPDDQPADQPAEQTVEQIVMEHKQEQDHKDDIKEDNKEDNKELIQEHVEEVKVNLEIENDIKENNDQPADNVVPEEHPNIPAMPDSNISQSKSAEPSKPIELSSLLSAALDNQANASIAPQADASQAVTGAPDGQVKADESQPAAKEEVKEQKVESEYEDVEDQDYDVFNSDDSTERKRIVKVNYKFGQGFITKSSIRNKITVFVKTFYNKRNSQAFVVDINSKVGSLIDKMEDSEEISSYHMIKIMYPMGRIRNLSLSETFASQNIPSGAKLVLIGKKDFCWDPARKGRDITLYNDKLTANKKHETDYETVLANIGFDSGQHYWEVTVDAFVEFEDIYIGVAKNTVGLYTKATDSGCFWGWMCTGDKKFESTPLGNHLNAFGGMCKIGDIVGVLLEFNNGIGSLFFYKNKVFVGRAFDNLPPGTYYPAVCMYYGEVQVTLNPSAKKP